ncbi:MAG: hypothetical protein AAFO69_14475, partial [Bacteroidota bacterium]
FSRDQFLFLESEVFFTEPNRVMEEVHRFLGLAHVPLQDITPKNKGRYTAKLDDNTREEIAAYYEESNLFLKKMGLNFSWLQNIGDSKS